MKSFRLAPLHLALVAALLLPVAAHAQPAAGSAAQPPADAAAPQVLYADFGLFNFSGERQTGFVSTRQVPLVPGRSYGWRILLPPQARAIRWREEFTLPVRPATWGAAETLGTRAISGDGRTAVTERGQAADQRLISNSWSVAAGDPPGRYVIRVFVDGALAGRFEFDVR